MPYYPPAGGGDLVSDTAHVGTVSPAIVGVVQGAVTGTVTLTGAHHPDGPTFPLVGGRYAVVPGGYATTCDLVDLADPAHPAIVSTITAHNAATAQFETACLVGAATVVLSLYDTTPTSGPVIEVWDVTDPAAPVYRGTGTGLQAQQMEQMTPLGAGTLAVGCTGSNYGAPVRVFAWDVATPAAPVLVGSVAPVDTTSGAGGGRPVGSALNALLALDDTHVAVVDSNANLYIMGVSASDAPTIVASICLSDPGDAYTLARLDANHLLCVAPLSLLVVSIATLSAPALVGQATCPAMVGVPSMAVLGTTAYVAEHGATRLTTVDVSTPGAPRVASLALALPSSFGLVALSSAHLVAYGHDGVLRVLTAPTLTPYAAQLGGAGITAGAVPGDWLVSGAVTSHDRPVLEAGAVATETITPDTTITVYDAAGTAYKVPAVLA